jgi:hypothetical protein
MPEVNALAGLSGLTWLGIASSRSSEEEVAAFARDYQAAFPLMVDADGAFARGVGARSTPIVLLARPAPAGGPDALNPALVPDPVTVELFEAYTPFSPGMGSVLRLRLHPEEPFADFVGYQGDLSCGSCHVHEARSWALTHHSVAYRTLYTRERAEDPACVGCHVTGMGQGGFVLGDHGSPFTDVTCESCHGPAGPHDGHRDDATASCVGCHDAEHSVAFSVGKGLPHIDHFRDGALSEDALMARIQALGSGEAAKPLLAFPDGPTVGSAACSGCHASQAAWHKADPHKKAHKRVAKEPAASGCVACHATPLAMNALQPPDATDPAAWRSSEGVGCESCHGPGGAHAKAPSKDNIVGLGDSCPECVIEAICTSCHTPQWDADWQLDRRLRAIQH